MFFVRLLSRCPLWFLYGLSDFLFLIGYHVLRYRRKLVQKNLQNSFPEKSAIELHQIERTFYKNLCDYAVESLKLLTITKEELAQKTALLAKGKKITPGQYEEYLNAVRESLQVK